MHFTTVQMNKINKHLKDIFPQSRCTDISTRVFGRGNSVQVNVCLSTEF